MLRHRKLQLFGSDATGGCLSSWLVGHVNGPIYRPILIGVMHAVMQCSWWLLLFASRYVVSFIDSRAEGENRTELLEV